MFKKYYEKRRSFVCPHCHSGLVIMSFWKWLSYPHLFDIWRYIKCPECGKRSWMKRVKKMSKIPRWWYAGFKKGFFHGCYCFIKIWWHTAANPLWSIRDWIRRKM